MSSPERQTLILSFLEIAVGQSAETAVQFLQAASWRLEEAIHLFYIGDEGSGGAATSSAETSFSGGEDASGRKSGVQDVKEDEVRAPLPVVREVLYDAAAIHKSSGVAFRDFEEASKHPRVWEADQSTASTSNTSGNNLASLYRPPFALMYHGTFDKAKVEASLQGKWLLANLQSTEEFSSHMLNRDTWSNEAVVDTIGINFIFWQVFHDTTEGRKVCTYYNLVSLPAVLVIDPITGQKMCAWSGMVQPEELLEDLIPYLDKGPKDLMVMALPHMFLRESEQNPSNSLRAADIALEEDEDEEGQSATLASLDASKCAEASVNVKESKTEKDAVINSTEGPVYPPLPEEPKAERSLMCRVGIRLPDGRRLQRNFLRADSVKLLWSFCYSEIDEAKTRPFRITLAIPGASQSIDYESELTFKEAGLSNSVISLVWE